MRVWIDQDCCTGAGLCVDHCPDLFIVLDDGIGYVHDGALVITDAGQPERVESVIGVRVTANQAVAIRRPRIACVAIIVSAVSKTEAETKANSGAEAPAAKATPTKAPAGKAPTETASGGAAAAETSKAATAETTNGSLVVAVPSDLQAEIEAKCLNGNFYSELPITMESTQRPREIRGKLGEGGVPIHLRTVNGRIRLMVLRSSV